MAEVTHEQSRAFYEDFSLAVGQRDWIVPNLRHEQLKLLVDAVLASRRKLRIADVGCGAGVMSDFLSRYGSVVGVDFSTAAIDAARRFTGRATFLPGGLEALPPGRYDFIALFDVLEHIPAHDRPGFIAEIRDRLADGGLVFFSTPFPSATHHKRAAGDPSLQIIDEEVELPAVVSEAAAAGLQLIRFEAYDVWGGSPEYQAMVFTPARSFGGPPGLRPRQLGRRANLVKRGSVHRARRLLFAARCLRRGRVGTMIWFLRGRFPDVRS
jgi:SAM-dependent methyltransferase